MPVSKCLRDSKGKLIAGGLFSVPHKESPDRLINDRRPFNALERRLHWATLPHGTLLIQVILEGGEVIRGSGDDLQSFFYTLKHLDDWVIRNVVGHPFNGSGYEDFGGDAEGEYMLGFLVLCMGDTNAVDIAQMTHLSALKRAKCMLDHEVLEYGHVFPPGPTYEGLYIDDHLAMQILANRKSRKALGPAALGPTTYRDEVIMKASRKEYASVGWDRSEAKEFNQKSSFTAWGTHVESATGIVAAPIARRKAIADMTLDLLNLDFVTKKSMQQVTGLFVHPFMHRRLLLSIFKETFTWIGTFGSNLLQENT